LAKEKKHFAKEIYSSRNHAISGRKKPFDEFSLFFERQRIFFR